MAIDPFSWIIIIAVSLASGAAGAGILVFWDEIKAWAGRTALQILNGIDQAIETAADALTNLIKEGRTYFKEVVVYTRNRLSGEAYAYTQKVKVHPNEIPEDIKEELGFNDYAQNKKVQVLRVAR
ncbi:MAG: hypothetical protein RM347_033735 [Nostoc sp. ChiQUE02]|uniref:hypothetical protein n=1 Tax=Nostoc sp. ChiQUE02 TaxID=3075377 RepID=UPI002AD24117|nr:hypothetical protein [Nostoc sp. ChiQUE02]MDZ8233516.1 hypothetical protein [Nostoc sp. ChiQUE02]